MEKDQPTTNKRRKDSPGRNRNKVVNVNIVREDCSSGSFGRNLHSRSNNSSNLKQGGSKSTSNKQL